ncbi:hypothetical protein NIES2130_36485 [Scytonema sp. HK-05]|nr:hypothetical protein NIES2130_36485 [Scytonema sp. HK-05]
MSQVWSAFLAKGIAHPQVIVVGDAILDCYLQGESKSRFKSPVPIVTVNDRKQIPGGAADTAFYFKSLGSQVIFLSVIGEDWEGHLLRQTLEESGITTSYLLTHTVRQTLSRQRVMLGSQLLLRTDSGSTDAIDSCTEQALINQLKNCFAQCQAVIVCDYGYGIVTQRLNDTLAQLQHSFPHVLIIYEKRTTEVGEENSDFSTVVENLSPNLSPARREALNFSPEPHSEGGWGVRSRFCIPYEVKSQEENSPSSLSSLSFPTSNKHIPNSDQLLALVNSYSMAGRKIVFTNGCFDILHAGHVSYLQRAKALGDILIIGVNSDDSIRRLKGPTRPINALEDRIQVLAALDCVDYLIAFEEDSPSNLIRKLCPDIYVKGGDYTKETLPETPVVEEYGGVIEFLPFVENRSTTKIIKRILQGKN